jgi:hypothetical protein
LTLSWEARKGAELKDTVQTHGSKNSGALAELNLVSVPLQHEDISGALAALNLVSTTKKPRLKEPFSAATDEAGAKLSSRDTALTSSVSADPVKNVGANVHWTEEVYETEASLVKVPQAHDEHDTEPKPDESGQKGVYATEASLVKVLSEQEKPDQMRVTRI